MVPWEYLLFLKQKLFFVSDASDSFVVGQATGSGLRSDRLRQDGCLPGSSSSPSFSKEKRRNEKEINFSRHCGTHPRIGKTLNLK